MIPACRHDHHTEQIPGWTVTTLAAGYYSLAWDAAISPRERP